MSFVCVGGIYIHTYILQCIGYIFVCILVLCLHMLFCYFSIGSVSLEVVNKMTRHPILVSL